MKWDSPSRHVNRRKKRLMRVNYGTSIQVDFFSQRSMSENNSSVSWSASLCLAICARRCSESHFVCPHFMPDKTLRDNQPFFTFYHHRQTIFINGNWELKHKDALHLNIHLWTGNETCMLQHVGMMELPTDGVKTRQRLSYLRVNILITPGNMESNWLT